MKKILFSLAVVAICTSCENTWDSESRKLFHDGCMESAQESNMEEAAAKSMCDCRLEKVMEKYPNFANAMEHAGDLMNDPDIAACK